MQRLGEREKVAHLLRRFGLGASEAELDFYGNGGLSKAIDRLLNYRNVEQTGPEVETFIQGADKKPNQPIKPQEVKFWWIDRLIATRRPLEEKMTLFWHDHFATAFSKVTSGPLIHQQNEIIRQNATGNFLDLLSNVSKDPAMIFWLDGQFNVKGRAQENFAREVMELFTLGIGNYTERDVQEAARAFTGYTISREASAKGKAPQKAIFVFRPRLHDDSEKTILGRTGNFDGDDVLKMLCEEKQTARYITTKIWEWFVYRDPDAKTIDKFSSEFYRSGLNIRNLLRDIMESDEFYSAKAMRSLFKNPIDFCVPTMRQLGVAEMDTSSRPLLKRGVLAAVGSSTKSMGMELLNPPDVAGWEGHTAWISSATMVERIKWADRLFGQPIPGKGGNVYLRLAAGGLFETGDPVHVVDRLASIFDAPLTPSNRNKIIASVKEVSGGDVTLQNVGKVATASARMIFGSPEFQMY